MNCRRCNIEMSPSLGLLNRLVAGLIDFPGLSRIGQTLSRTGKADLVSVLKCPKCGHSVTQKPYFQHDSSCCTYLGSREIDEEKFDLYHCGQTGRRATILARYGDSPPDYASGLTTARRAGRGELDDISDIPYVKAMGIAYKLAQARNLITGD